MKLKKSKLIAKLGYNTPPLAASRLGGDTKLAANLVSVSTVISALTIPIWLGLLS